MNAIENNLANVYIAGGFLAIAIMALALFAQKEDQKQGKSDSPR